MKQHRLHKNRQLMCEVCSGKGRSAKDVQLYHCDGCDKDLGHLKFDKDCVSSKVKAGRRGGDLLCLDCSSKIPCDACKVRFPKTSWPPQTLKNQKKQGSKIVCRSCKDQGRTACDPALYTCKHCHKELGSARFARDLLRNLKYHERRQLICLVCASRG